jgi:TolB protein
MKLRIALVLAVLGALVLGASSADAAFPGQNGRIAFSDYMSGQIFAVNPDGTGLRKLTDTPEGLQAGWPDWSADGRRIVYSRFAGGSDPARVWVMRADGTHQHPLVADAKGFRDLDPNFTPDGRGIVFARCKPRDGVCAIWRMRADGTHKRALTSYRDGVHEAVDFNPSVSPNGRRIAFTRYGGGGISAQVYVMGAFGGHAHPITHPALEGGDPDWSPSGRRITFSSNQPHPGSSVFTIRPNGKGLRRVTPSRYPHNDAGSIYSPRGDRLAFIDDRHYSDFCCVDLLSSDPDGRHERRVNRHFKHMGIIDPAWGSAPLLRRGG